MDSGPAVASACEVGHVPSSALVSFSPHMRLPSWSLAPLAVINLFYLAAMIVTLVCRMTHLPIGKSVTRAMNVLFLIAPPFGTILGIYGLWKVDRTEEARPLRI